MPTISFPVGLGPRWKIQKQPLYPGHPEPWLVLPPKAAYNAYEWDITTYETGAQALEIFNVVSRLTLNEGTP